MASRLKYQSMVNHLLSIIILTQVINLSYVASLAPQIKDLKVQCDSDGMEVNVTFDSPFNGIIFSKGYYNDMGCRYVQEKSGSSNLAFKIPAEGCGTASVLSKDVKDSKQFENVIIFQNDPIYQEVWDSARLLSCRYSLQRDLPIQEKRVVFKPFLVDMLDVIRVPMADFAGDEHKVDCWMDVTKGRYPNNSPIDGPVKVGENLTLAIYIRDTRKRTDIRVKDCYAYDNEESVNDKSPALLQLSGEDGCPLKPKLMDVWKRTTTGVSEATVLAYSTVTAFKFPEHSNVHLTCNVELCKNQCADRCSLEAKDIAKMKNGEASKDGDDEMSKSSESNSDGEDDDDDSNSNKNDESDVKPVSISTKAAPAPKSDSTKSEDDEDEDSNADEEAKTETTSAKPTTASSVKDADEDEDAASEDAAEGSTSERGGRKSDGEDNEEGTDEETSVGSSTSTSTTTSTTTAKPSEDEDEEEDKSDEEDEDKKSETSPTTTTSTTSTTSTTTTTTTTEKPSERSEDDEEDEDGVDDSDTDSRKRSLRPSKAEEKSIADDEDEDEEDNSSKLISSKAKQSMKTKAEASEDEDYDDDLQSSRGSSTSVSPVTTTTTPIPKTPLIIVIKPEKSRKKIKEAARRGRIESRSRQAVRSSSSKLGSSRSISSQVSRESCCSDVTTTSSRSDRKSTTSTTKSPIIARSSSGRSVRRSSRFDESDSENVSNLQSKSQRSSRQSKKQAKTTTTTTTTSTTVAPKKIKTTSTKRPRRRSTTTTTTTTTTTPRTTTEFDEDKEETEAPRTFRKSTRKPKRPVVRTRKSLTDRLFIPHSNDRQTTPKTVTTTISPSISSSSTFRIASNRFSTHRSNPYLRSTLKPATIPSSRNSLRLTSSSTVAPPKRLADFDEFKDNEALIENEKPDRNRIKPSSSSAATGASRRWDGDELFNPFKEIEYEPVRLNNNRNQRRRRSLYTLFNDQHIHEKLSNYNMPIIF